MKKTSLLLCVLMEIITALVLTACGGGGGEENKTPPAVSPGIIVAPSSGLVTTEAAGGSATIDVSLATQPADDVTITIESLDLTEVEADITSMTFTAADWDKPQPITLTGVDDDMADGNQVINVVLTPASADAVYDAVPAKTLSVTNSDDDAADFTLSKQDLAVGEEPMFDYFDVTLNTQPAPGEVVVLTVTSGNEDEGQVDKATLTFTDSTWSDPQTVMVSGVNDYLVGDNPAFSIAVAVDTDATTAAEYDVLAPKAIGCVNADDDVAGVMVTPKSISVSEGATTGSFNVSINTQPASGQVVVITVTSADDRLLSVDKPTLTFTDSDWSFSQTVTVTPVDDQIADDSQTLDINMAIDAGATTADEYDAVSVSAVGCTRSDNDSAGFTVTPMASTVLDESSTPYQGISIKPNTQPAPGEEIKVTISSTDTTEATVSKSALIFTNGSWQSAQSFDITAVDDLMVDGDQSVSINFGTSGSTATEYSGLSISPLNLTIVDTSVSEGTLTVPLDITWMRPYSGTASKDTISYYKVTGLTPGKLYDVTLTDSTEYLTLLVYADLFSTDLCSGSTQKAADSLCVVSPSGTELYLSVDPSLAFGSTMYTLNVIASGNKDLMTVSEGNMGNYNPEVLYTETLNLAVPLKYDPRMDAYYDTAGGTTEIMLVDSYISGWTHTLEISMDGQSEGTYNYSNASAYYLKDGKVYSQYTGTYAYTYLEITTLEGAGGRVAGNYSFLLCESSAITAGTCDNDVANRIGVRGTFDITRGADK